METLGRQIASGSIQKRFDQLRHLLGLRYVARHRQHLLGLLRLLVHLLQPHRRDDAPRGRQVAAPVVEQRFDASGAVWDLEDLDKQVGGFFEGRDPNVGFAADSIMKLEV